MSRRLAVPLIGLALMVAAPAQARTVAVAKTAALTLVGEQRSDLAGAAVANAGDVNGDGRPDMIVGAPFADPPARVDAGAAYVVFGGCAKGTLKLAALGACGFRIDGAVPLPPGMRHLGASALTSGAGDVVGGLGDVNGDGLADVVVSGREAGRFGGAPTVVYVVFGKRDSAPVDLAALGAGGFVISADGVGLEVVDGHPAGDVNGDGLADIAVRTSIDGDEDAGSLTVVLGRSDSAPVVLGTAGVTGTFGIAGQLSGMLVGQAVAPAGDVNRDGIGDLLIGAPGVSRKRTSDERGEVFVLFGRKMPKGIRLMPGRRFGGYEVPGPRRLGGFGWSLARFGAAGFVAGAPGPPSRGLHGAGGAWILPKRGARPLRIGGSRNGGPAGVVVATSANHVLVLARGRSNKIAGAWRYSRRAHRELTYSGLRNAREARIAGAGMGRGAFILGSPGNSRAYLVTP
jgi:hypothetical protein